MLSRVLCAILWVLADYFINTSVYMLISTCSFLPAHHLSLLVTISFFPKCLRLLLFCKEVHLYPFLDSTSK